MVWQRVNAKVTATTGRVKDNGIISDITLSPRRLSQTHTPLVFATRRTHIVPLPSVYNSPFIPLSHKPSLPLTLQPAHPAGQTWRGTVFSVTFLSHHFFSLLLCPLRPAPSAASASQARKYYTTETTLAGDHLLPANTAAAHQQMLTPFFQTHANKKP